MLRSLDAMLIDACDRHLSASSLIQRRAYLITILKLIFEFTSHRLVVGIRMAGLCLFDRTRFLHKLDTKL